MITTNQSVVSDSQEQQPTQPTQPQKSTNYAKRQYTTDWRFRKIREEGNALGKWLADMLNEQQRYWLDLARFVGVKRDTLEYAALSKRRSTLTPYQLKRIADFFEVSFLTVLALAYNMTQETEESEELALLVEMYQMIDSSEQRGILLSMAVSFAHLFSSSSPSTATPSPEEEE